MTEPLTAEADVDLEAVLSEMPAGVDLDPRGSTCWWVLIDGDQIGWVRLNNAGNYTATVPGWVNPRWKKRRGRNAQHGEFDRFAAAVEFVSHHRDNVNATRGHGRGQTSW